MPKISNKGKMMPSSPIRKLVPYSDEAKKRGIKVYHLNIGQPDIETPKEAIKALQNEKIEVLAYSHSAGILSCRKKVAEYYKRWSIDVTEEEIILTAGGSEAILFAFNSCLDPGDEVIIPEPFYANYNGFAVSSGVVVKPIVSVIDNGFALPSIEEFEKLITPKTKAIMICNPNNPTGYLYSKEELKALAAIVKKYDLFLMADEVYREFAYDGAEIFSVMNLKEIEQNVILLDSVSKRYSACGARLGMFITKNKEVYKTAMKFAQARLSPPSFAQIFTEAAVDTPSSYFDEVQKEYIARRNVVVESINKMEGCYCPNPKGAFYAVARLPIDDSDRFCQWLLEDFNYKGETVMFAPATGFYSTPGKGKDEVRISYCLNVNDMKASMKCLEEALKVYPGKTI
ncbi:MAG: pyridoxal phosphate-dependent aminotransferase [Bacteroidales bacterium]|jgi:aspartate aminotransferase|nr:pyridoxal phosphate-dependent aminotransferase [Bacteroidales bacterium]MDD2687041.1 pyridoxal phosphate-dependent aminotransferase [Bacteroidales bacterium]MDD3329920.1 pyridoxal phosphate-dependent aminotransferase [Bacteroidales bacterium]MDD3691167.1 pyridoxal phosphate-dependent aminotransferase [Bacteroidales bacterium]MDD4044172.1 pyridoxal phosphate-dependent aminotransferase [Bacteroidales bacterium]